MKRIIAMLLVLCFGLGLCACGEEQVGAFTILEEIGEKQYAGIYRKGDKVSEVVEAAMKNLAASGTLSRISSSWLGSDAIVLTGDAEALSAIEDMPQSRTLIIGVDTDAPPYAYTDGGNLAGMSVDIAKAIGSLLGWDVKILAVKSSEIATQLASGNIDCALGFAPQCVSTESYTVGETFLTGTVVLAVPEGSDVTSIRKIDDQRIGTISDPGLESIVNAHEKLQKHSSGATVYLTAPRCLSALSDGWCVAIAMDARMLQAYAYSFVPPAAAQ